MESIDKFCGSPFWDINQTWNTENPRFTPCFEQTVLVWFPALFILVYSWIDICSTVNSPGRRIPYNWRISLKLVILVLLMSVCIFEFIYNFSQRNNLFPVDISTPLIKLVTMLICAALVLLHKEYGQNSSGLLFIFWFLVIFLGFPQLYSEIGENMSTDKTYLGRIYLVYYGLCVLSFFLHCFSDLPPESSDYAVDEETESLSPEERASFPSKVTFSWLDYLMYQGFKRELLGSDLWLTSHQYRVGESFSLFNKYWKRSCNKTTENEMQEDVRCLLGEHNEDKKPSVLYVLFRAFGMTYLLGVSLELVEILLSFVSPALLKFIIEFVKGNEPNWHGYMYAVLFLFVTTLTTLLQNQYMRFLDILGLRIKSALTSAVYRKVLKLSKSAQKEYSAGDINILMSVDADTFTHTLYYLNTVWSVPLQIILCLTFLWQLLGPSVLAGLVVAVVLIPFNVYFAKKYEVLQSELMKKISERAKVISEILSGIKVLKFFAWEPRFEDRVLKIREKELIIIQKEGIMGAALTMIFSCSPFLIALATFSTYILIDRKNTLDSSKVFVSLSLFNMLNTPLSMITQTIYTATKTSVSVKRLNKFLNSEELDTLPSRNDPLNDDPLVIRNGDFSWDNELYLIDINLQIKRGSLVAVVGAVGSGKSSLISAFLGEMKMAGGWVDINGSVAYAPQVAWIQNCTLQDNILFSKPLDSERYQIVIDACALKPDLEILPGGDQTEIGERGINLSGGQKQRISLARAVYSDCDIYLLDDPLSSVDSHVGKHIFENVIGPKGILRGKTRLFVTNNITFLQEVDLIVVLKDRRISEVGTYQELIYQNGDFSKFIETYSEGNGEDSKVEMVKTKNLSRQITMDDSSSVSSEKKSLSDSSVDDEYQRLIEDEEVKIGGVKWGVYAVYLRALGICTFFTALSLTVFNEGVVMLSNFWLSIWADDVNIVVNGTQNSSRMDMYLEIYGLLGLIHALAVFFCGLCWCWGSINAGRLLHSLLLGNILRSPMSFFDTTPQGRILNRFTKDLEAVDDRMSYTVEEFFSYLFMVIGILFVVSYSTPIFSAVIVPVGLVYYFLQRFYISTSVQIKRLESVSASPVASHFGESVSGSSVIRAYEAEERFIKELDQKINFNQTCSFTSSMASLWLAVRLQMIGNLVIFFAALFAVLCKDSLSSGIVGLSISYALEITQGLDMLMYYAAQIETDIVAVERIKEYTQIIQEASWNVSSCLVSAHWPNEGKIEFIDFGVRYREGLELVLKGLNFTIRPGEKVGIVGRTGAGKSSITLSLFRVIESATGKILIDGVDISELGLHKLRSCITIIPQDPVLFSGSLRSNLDPFDNHSDSEIWRSLELANLHSFVKGLPEQLQHQISEEGGNLSVGQRQLVCLARALLNKTKILVLDEATAAVDLETDDFIQKTIRKEFADCTVITIAHRINTIMDSDRVLVLDQGELVEFDAPTALLNNPDSIFHRMAYDAGLVQ